MCMSTTTALTLPTCPTGTGKSEFINAMLERKATKTNAFGDTTKSIRVIKGSFHGIQVRA